MAHTVPPLSYDHSALEPIIDTETMKLHQGKHHASYVSNLNKALDKHPELHQRSLEELLRDIDRVPEDIRTDVRNHGGGHANHSLFWTILAPRHEAPAGRIGDALRQSFGGLDQFTERFNDAGAKLFGSGWVWLVAAPSGKIELITTANQDSPLMHGLYPILGNDVWEHAYYLKYQNRRGDYLKAWWQVVNWAEVNRRFEEALRVVPRAA